VLLPPSALLSSCSCAASAACRGLTIEEFPLLLLPVAEYIAVRRGLGGTSKADALAGKRAEVRAAAATGL
jgi:hypothetical protein